MFLGTHQHTLDDKGRVILPARFRDRLATGLVFTPGQEHCIDVWPAATFQRYLEDLRNKPRENSEFRGFLRMLTANAFEHVPDSQGRVTIPPKLRDYAGVTKDLTINGADEKVQVWDTERWERYCEQIEPAFADLDSPFTL